MPREVQFVVQRRRPVTAKATEGLIHLHWLWKQGPVQLRNVKTAVAVCGRYIKRPEESITAHLEDVTCPTCKTRARKEV